MASETAAQRPPSPPHSHDGDFGLAAVQDHNERHDSADQPRSIKAEVPSVEADVSNVDKETTPEVQETDRQQDQYGDPSHYQTAPVHAYYAAEPTYQRKVQPATPPMYNDVIRTRSGRAIGTPMTPDYSDRRSGSPRPRKSPRNRGKGGGPELVEPLSVATKDYEVRVRDMAAWVNRPASDRHAEAEKKEGYIARPMNAFMLYRSAYAERAKQFCKENNHQVVSQISGKSWPMEPEEIHKFYYDLYHIERDNHAIAFPAYKFAPNKSGTSKPKKRDWDESDDDGDSTYQGPKPKRTRGDNYDRSRSGTPYSGRAPNHPLAHLAYTNHHPSSYQASNPYGQPPPRPQQYPGHGHYYQQTVAPYGAYEDVNLRRVPNPMSYQSQGLVGLPHHMPPTSAPRQSGEPLDPQLLYADPSATYGHGGYDDQTGQIYGEPQYDYGEYAEPQQYSGAYGEPSYHPGMATLTTGEEQWAQVTQQPGADFDAELSKSGW